MDLGRNLLYLSDMPIRAMRRWRRHYPDYRAYLFEDTRRRLKSKPRRILEIGPRDGEDTRRLDTLGAEKLVLVELPSQKERLESWLPSIKATSTEVLYTNFMYDRQFEAMEPFDLIWCTGVLYHNPEQLRFVRQLFDLVAPDGLLVLETATARRRVLRNENCVEIWYPVDKDKGNAVHLSANITHVPSARAVGSWLEMVGFDRIEKSDCHRRVLRSLAATRVAFIARRPVEPKVGTYYNRVAAYPVGRAR
ncbi:MAG: methyltransferase domain-containing protein [Pseudorhodoplanes sp.]